MRVNTFLISPNGENIKLTFFTFLLLYPITHFQVQSHFLWPIKCYRDEINERYKGILLNVFYSREINEDIRKEILL